MIYSSKQEYIPYIKGFTPYKDDEVGVNLWLHTGVCVVGQHLATLWSLGDVLSLILIKGTRLTYLNCGYNYITLLVYVLAKLTGKIFVRHLCMNLALVYHSWAVCYTYAV